MKKEQEKDFHFCGLVSIRQEGQCKTGYENRYPKKNLPA